MTDRVRARRLALGLSQEQLAKDCGVSRLTILSLELGRTDPSLSLAFRVANRLGMTVDQLFSDSGPDAPSRGGSDCYPTG